MIPTGDELAGVADLFGGLTREELREAVGEAAFRAGEDVEAATGDLDAAIDDALEAYRLVAYDPAGGNAADADGDEELLVPGPTAFPTLPEGSEDLPHIVDVERREIDRERAGRAAVERFRRDAEITIDAGDAERAALLVDVSYDVETWAPVDLADERERLDDAADRDPAAAVEGATPTDGEDAGTGSGADGGDDGAGSGADGGDDGSDSGADG